MMGHYVAYLIGVLLCLFPLALSSVNCHLVGVAGVSYIGISLVGVRPLGALDMPRDLRGPGMPVRIGARGNLNPVEHLQHLKLDLLEVLRRVEVLHVAHGQVKSVVGAVVLKVVVVGQRVFDGRVQE